jgi:hypothetical protein
VIKEHETPNMSSFGGAAAGYEIMSFGEAAHQTVELVIFPC